MSELRDRIAAVLDTHYPIYGMADGEPTDWCQCGLPRSHVADAVIHELDMGTSCAANGCRVRRNRRGRRKVTADEIAEVTAVYYAAPYGLKHSAVMEHFGCGEGRANLLIRRAREAGLIEKSGQGRAAPSLEKR
jgi:hypothetical protein